MILRTKTDAFDYEILERIDWNSFETMYKKQLACLTFKLLKNQLPNCLHNGKQKRWSSTEELPFRKLSYKKSFAYRDAVIWNQLSNETVDLNSIHLFKRKLNAEKVNASGAMRKKNDDFIYY